MIQSKSCKGQSKAISFKGCSKPTDVSKRKWGLCPSCYPKFLTTTELGKLIMQKAIIKVQKPRIEMEQAQKEKTERKTLGNLLINVRCTVHEYIRLRDKGKPCISCNTAWMPTFQAGHFFKSELFSTLRFDERNICGQCVQCNIKKDGNESGYRVGILNRFGKDHLEYLDSLAQLEKQQTHKWERSDLDEIRRVFRAKIKQNGIFKN